MKCRYGYVKECGEVVAQVDVTVYPADPDMRESSTREMCKGCFDYLKNNNETVVHKVEVHGTPNRG